LAFGVTSDAPKRLRLDVFVVWIESGTITRPKKLQGMSWLFFSTISIFLGKPEENWK
jgi:hypothetical protein